MYESTKDMQVFYSSARETQTLVQNPTTFNLISNNILQ